MKDVGKFSAGHGGISHSRRLMAFIAIGQFNNLIGNFRCYRLDQVLEGCIETKRSRANFHCVWRPLLGISYDEVGAFVPCEQGNDRMRKNVGSRQLV